MRSRPRDYPTIHRLVETAPLQLMTFAAAAPVGRKDTLRLLRVNRRRIIVQLDNELSFRRISTQVYDGVGIAEFAGIGQQVKQDLEQPVRVGLYLAGRRRQVKLQRLVLKPQHSVDV